MDLGHDYQLFVKKSLKPNWPFSATLLSELEVSSIMVFYIHRTLKVHFKVHSMDFAPHSKPTCHTSVKGEGSETV